VAGEVLAVPDVQLSGEVAVGFGGSFSWYFSVFTCSDALLCAFFLPMSNLLSVRLN
jgi:hypothetical protein